MEIVRSFLADDLVYHFTKLQADYSLLKNFYRVTDNKGLELMLYVVSKGHDFEEFFDDKPSLTYDTYLKEAFGLLSDHNLGPTIRYVDAEHGIILMDFVKDQLVEDRYLDAIDGLILFQKISPTGLIASRHYGPKAMGSEIDFALDNINYLTPKQKSQLKDYLLGLLLGADIESVPECLCHRDYQMRNLFFGPFNILDGQDMCIGNQLQDLACLLFQSNHVLEEEHIREYARYFYQRKNITYAFDKFYNQLLVLALVRTIKSHGTHSRYFIRNNNSRSNYLLSNNRIHLEMLGEKFPLVKEIITSYKLVPIVLAAGRGKRMQETCPKALCLVQSKPMLHIILDKLVKLLPLKIIIVVGYKKEDIISSLKDYPYKQIEFVTQEQQLGTGHAVMQARPLVPQDYISMVCFGDNPNTQYETLLRLVQEHIESRRSILLTHKGEPSSKSSGRIIKRGASVVRIYEDENPEFVSDEFLGGVQIHQSKALFDSLEKINNNNRQKEYYLTDIVEHLVACPGVSTMVVPKIELINVNTKEDLALTNNIFGQYSNV